MCIRVNANFTKKAIKYCKGTKWTFFSRLNEINDKLTGAFCESQERLSISEFQYTIIIL